MKIGMTMRTIEWNKIPHFSIEYGYYDWLADDHTIVPLATPSDIDKMDDTVYSVVDDIDLLIMPGGKTDSKLLAFEISLCEQMCLIQKPILGICRGMFVLNTVFGGKRPNNRHDEGNIIKNEQTLRMHMWTSHYVFGATGEEHKVQSAHDRVIIAPPPDAYTVLRDQPWGRGIPQDQSGAVEAFIKDNAAGVMFHPERDPEHWLPTEIKELTGL